MHSKHRIITNLQGRYLRSPSDCELTQESDRKNAHDLGNRFCPVFNVAALVNCEVAVTIRVGERC
jgi:hypothetical protein